MSAFVPWVPANRMLAEGMTKNEGDPIDLLRACVRHASYQISPGKNSLKISSFRKITPKTGYQTPQVRVEEPSGRRKCEFVVFATIACGIFWGIL